MGQELTVNMYVFGFMRQPPLPPLNFTEGVEENDEIEKIPMEIKIHYVHEWIIDNKIKS